MYSHRRSLRQSLVLLGISGPKSHHCRRRRNANTLVWTSLSHVSRHQDARTWPRALLSLVQRATGPCPGIHEGRCLSDELRDIGICYIAKGARVWLGLESPKSRIYSNPEAGGVSCFGSGPRAPPEAEAAAYTGRDHVPRSCRRFVGCQDGVRLSIVFFAAFHEEVELCMSGHS